MNADLEEWRRLQRDFKMIDGFVMLAPEWRQDKSLRMWFYCLLEMP